jgi:EmrB/QacA subfamily drug resistance transporter
MKGVGEMTAAAPPTVRQTASQTASLAASRVGQPANPHHQHRWLILGVLGLAQLMVVLDATIVNIALPSAQHALHFSDSDRQWVVTGYALAFGSLLLLGGRLSDLFGRKVTFLTGLVGFAVASALGGAATGFGLLVVARALQGGFGALLAPAALSLLTTTFTDPGERGKAFGIFGAIAGAGGAVGLLLGGVLTEYASWRWCLYVNLGFAGLAAIGALLWLQRQAPVTRPKLDIPGTLAVSAGLLALVYGFSHANTDGWATKVTLVSLALGVNLLVGFVWLQTRVAHPLLPLRVLLDRNRGGSFLAVFVMGVGMFGVFLFLTYYLQATLGYSPVKSGLAFLPLVGALTVCAGMATVRLQPRWGPRPLVSTGMLIVAAAMVLFTRLGLHSAYATGILPALLLMGAGLGLAFAPAMNSATLDVGASDAGIASATVNTSQQVGGSIGTALLNTLAASATTSYLSGRAPTALAQAHATLHGYATAYWWSAAIFAVGAVVCGLLLRPGPQAAMDASPPAFAH